MNFRDFLNSGILCDSHLHLSDFADGQVEFINNPNYFCISSCHSKTDFQKTQKLKSDSDSNIFISFGIHPQNPDESLIPVLEELLQDRKIDAIGECGFDFFTDEFKAKKEEQQKVFDVQMELAVKYNLPVVIHGRKCVEQFFANSTKLKKCPSVIFHSFMGTAAEANSILAHGVNASFSFSKQLSNGNKKAIECVKNLSPDRLLFETDAPYQTLKGEKITAPEQIFSVYEAAFNIREENDFSEFSKEISDNFKRFLGK